MWLIKKKKQNKSTILKCIYCGNHNSKLLNRTVVWRGQRYIVCKCKSCNRSFYMDESGKDIIDLLSTNDTLVENEELLNSAEEELKHQADIDGDHRF